MKRGFSMVVVLVVVLIGVAVGIYFNLQKLENFIYPYPKPQNDVVLVTKAPVPSNICVTEKAKLLAVVSNFENLQKAKNPQGVLALFITPTNANDFSDYQNLSGDDASISPRLYNNVSTNYDTISYMVISLPTENQGESCTVRVEEQRSNYGGPADPRYLPSRDLDFDLDLIYQGNVWKISAYQSTDPKVRRGEFSGFLMEYAN